MIHNNLVKQNRMLVGSQVSSLLGSDVKTVSMNSRYYLHSYSRNGLQRNLLSLKHLHISQYHYSTSHSKINQLTLKTRYLFSTPSPNYNQFQTIRQLSTLSPPNNKFHPTTHESKFLSQQYTTISLDIEKKLEKIQGILHSSEKDMYKIVQEIIIVLEAFANVNRREVLQENVVNVVKEFGKKLVSAYLQTLQAQQLQHLEIKNSHRNQEPQQTDSTYSLHDNYSTPPLETGEKQFLTINTPAPVDLNFILFYIETIKTWLLMKLESDAVVREAEAQLFDIFAVREVSALNDTLKGAVQNLVTNYIEEQSTNKREMFPFELKLRGLCLLPFFENKKHIQKYFQRLADQNLGIYLKQSQILTLMYDTTQLQPTLNDCTQFIYQIQSTRIYQNLAQINCAYLKALFIQYTRNFMVSYQEIQFYELFRDMQARIRYPTIRTFIRLTKILNVEAADLHCEYNKTMNKYNYNIIISIVISQNYSIENTRFDELFELFEGLNAYEQCGEVMYDQLAKFLRAYVIKQENGLKKEELQRIYKLFQHILREAHPIFKYQNRQALNRQYGRKSTQLLAVLFDLLIQKYPQVVVQGSKLIRSYLLSQQGNALSIASLPYDDREIRVEVSGGMVKQKIDKVKEAYAKVVERAKDMSTKKLGEFLDSVNFYALMNVQWIKANNNNTQVNQQKQPNQPSTSNPSLYPSRLLPTIYPTLPSHPFQLSLIKQTIQPIIKQYLDLANKDMIKKLSNQQFRQLYRNLYLSLAVFNSVEFKKETFEVMDGYVEQLRRKVLYEMKFAMDGVEKQVELKRTTGIERLQISTPKGNVELLLTLHELIKLTQKLHAFHNLTKNQHHLSSTSTPLPSLQPLTVSLPLIYNFINKIAIKNLKGIQQQDLINMLMFLKTLEEIKAEQKQNVLLLEINTLVWEYLYQSMSMFLMYMSDKGKIYLKLTNTSAEQFINVINHFVANKAIFRALPQKKRLVPLQTILIGLVRRKYIKLTASHLKRSQSTKTFLAFLQIFECPENLTVDMKKFIEQTQFTTTQLERVPSDILERFSDTNWTIARYLEDSNQNLTTAKKLGKLNADELRKQFEEGKSGKIYEMVLKSSKFALPFILPEPKKDDVNAKVLYILERIYQKISKKNNYGVTKQKRSSSQKEQTNTKSSKKNQTLIFTLIQQPAITQSDTPITQTPTNQPYQPTFISPNSFHQINLAQQKAYIKAQSLVSYTYENHYKLSSNKLPIHFKKENWKNIYAVPKELQVESLEIDQKIDQKIYKQVLLATLGYVQKVKLIAKQFHAHSFIQYTAAQLDMEVFYHGCIARISRKNKPQENVLLVCAVQTNYKLLYICTHILRESGENAYIVMDKTKQTDFKDFLEKLLPQPFEAEESQIVDKVVKGEIALD